MPLPSTQKALFLDSKSGPFTLKSHSIPKPGPGQLLVRIEAAALNPVDWKIQKHGIFIEKYPALIGTDIAGVVEEIGEGASASGFAPGDRVVFQGAWTNEMAGYQQYTLTNTATTAKIPPHISFDEAATIPVAAAAAVAGSYLPAPHGAGLTAPFDASGRGKYAGTPAVVLGGATSVGQFAIQLASLSGFSPLITTASPKHTAHLTSLGATHVLDRSLPLPALLAAIRLITPDPIPFVYDAVSLPDTQAAGHAILAAGGTLVLVLPSQIQAEEGKNVCTCLGIWTLPHSRELGVRFYESLEGLLEKGEIKPNRVEVVPGGLGGIVEGLKRLELDQVSGVKLVVHPQETA